MPAVAGLLIARDSAGAYLVARVGDESRRAHWPTYLVDEDGTQGPNLLGNWIRFIPSDWQPVPAGEPLPDRVRLLADLLAPRAAGDGREEIERPDFTGLP